MDKESTAILEKLLERKLDNEKKNACNGYSAPSLKNWSIEKLVFPA